MTHDRQRDEGFTMVELLVAVGIFAVLMAIVTTGTIRGFQAIREIRSLASVQAEQQNALLWITRLLRYADNPAESLTPKPWTPLGGAGVRGPLAYQRRGASLTARTLSDGCVDQRLVAKNRLAREHRNHLGDDAKEWQRNHVHLWVAEEPEQVLIQNRATSVNVVQLRAEESVRGEGQEGSREHREDENDKD